MKFEQRKDNNTLHPTGVALTCKYIMKCANVEICDIMNCKSYESKVNRDVNTKFEDSGIKDTLDF